MVDAYEELIRPTRCGICGMLLSKSVTREEAAHLAKHASAGEIIILDGEIRLTLTGELKAHETKTHLDALYETFFAASDVLGEPDNGSPEWLAANELHEKTLTAIRGYVNK